MKRIVQILGIALCMFSGHMIMAQADTVLVPHLLDGDPFGAINKFIGGDTTATGERDNPERFYKLQKDKIYLLNGEFHADYDLRLIADEVEEGEKPPIVASTSGSDGVIQLIQFKLLGNGYIKNIIFQMTPPSGTGESNASFFLSKLDGDYEFDNVTWEWGLWTSVVTEKPVNKIVVRNCYFRNNEHRTNIWNGRGVGFYQENPADTVIMQNNTFFNMNAFAFFADISSLPPKFFMFDHNTLVNSMKFPIHSFWLPNAIVTNNIFYNTHSFGENAEDKVGQDPGGLQYGIIDIDLIPSNIIGLYGIDESERVYTVANNVFFYEQEIKDYWTKYDLQENPFMNERVEGMFSDDTAYPGLTLNNMYDEDPGFVNPGDGRVKMIKWMSNRRDKKGNTYWGYDPDGSKFGVEWPLPEDLSFTNTTYMTSSVGGFPLGDLNRYPDQKVAWQEWVDYIAGVDQVEHTISQLMITPNPISSTAVISYDTKKASKVELNVYTMSGKKLATVYNGKQTIGNNTISIDLTDYKLQNGTYILQLKTAEEVSTKKFVVMRK